MDLQKIVEKRTIFPGPSFEESEILIIYKSEEVKPDPEKVNVLGIKQQIAKMDAVIANATMQKNKMIDLLQSINNDPDIDGSVSDIPSKI